MTRKRKHSDLFVPVVSENRLHQAFDQVRTSHGAEPARLMMNEVYAEFADPDGNFVQQFQTDGFDARTFELYLYAYLRSARFEVRREKPNPDFVVRRAGVECAIEATTANAPSARTTQRRSAQDSLWATARKIDHELPIRFGSPLKSKLDKRYDGKAYWQLEHCRDMPFVIAIQAFHEPDSLSFTSAPLGHYLYGRKSPPRWTKAGKLFLTAVKLQKHRYGRKVIPSNFFAQPGAENISAVLFSNSGTWPKFNRMGYQAGYHRGNVTMIRRGTRLSADPNSAIPEEFAYDLDFPPCEEPWGQGLVVFHNPNAARPLPPHFFPGAVANYYEGRRLTVDVPNSGLVPFASITIIACVEDPDLTPDFRARPGITSLRLDEFEALGPPRHSRTLPTSQEKEWFASEDMRVVGTVAQDLVDKDWLYVLLVQKPRVGLRCEDLQTDIATRDDARRRLLDCMERRRRKGPGSGDQGTSARPRARKGAVNPAPSRARGTRRPRR